MSTTFPRAKRSQRGYRVDEVEEFLESARVAYSAEPGSPHALDSDAIRSTAFRFSRGGYATDHVDRALERLEDAFAARERERARNEMGVPAFNAQVRELAREIVTRLDRPHGQRFQRKSFFSDGYDRKQVDAFTNRILGYFRDNKPLPVDEVRTVAFRPRKGGYREAQVDIVLDAVIRVMLAVK
ncbi:MAG TPA: DivIVA domain-containing protein [Terrimesophilobacter sp.]|nr:DivIVA domain-containing protein [Terrimesophilobacter sp.]HRQ00710.1 DivIVA domain-containing protein [Terrimesophilobacter sp.]